MKYEVEISILAAQGELFLSCWSELFSVSFGDG